MTSIMRKHSCICCFRSLIRETLTDCTAAHQAACLRDLTWQYGRSRQPGKGLTAGGWCAAVKVADSCPALSKMHHRRSQVAAACSAEVALQHVDTLMAAKSQDLAPCAASAHLAMASEPFPHVCLELRRYVHPTRLRRWPAAGLTWSCLHSGRATTAQVCKQARPRHQHQVCRRQQDRH